MELKKTPCGGEKDGSFDVAGGQEFPAKLNDSGTFVEITGGGCRIPLIKMPVCPNPFRYPIHFVQQPH
jgi:hypothetical protein